MTHSIDTPFPPPSSGATHLRTDEPMETATTGQSTKDVAQDEARNVGQTAAQAGSQVASTAADQAREVAQVTQRQAQDLLHEGRSQLREQAVTQQQKAADGLSSLARQLRGMADGTSDGAPGPARDLIQQASGKLEEFGGWLQTHEPAELLDEVRAFARRRPGTFLLGAAVAGVLAGRLTTGIKAAHTGSGIVGGSPGGSAGQHRQMTGAENYAVDPSSAYTGYGDTGAAGFAGAPSTGTPLPPPPYGTVPPEGSVVPPTTPAGWDDPARRPGGVG
jgi:hypothetical protein